MHFRNIRSFRHKKQRRLFFHISIELRNVLFRLILLSPFLFLIEGMLHGKTILMCPIFADQLDNAQQLVELGITGQISGDLRSDIEHMLNNDSYV